MQRLITSALCTFAAFAALTASGAVMGSLKLENGEPQKGVVRWSAREKAYIVTKGKIEQQFKATDVAEIDIEKPAAFDAAVAQVEKGQGTAAIPALQKIVKDYAHLQWDKVAGRYLAEAYLAADKPDDALKACKGIIDDEPSAAYRGELAPAYWSALLRLNRRSPLEKSLEKAMKGKDRFARGAALLMYGDIAMQDGKESADACKKALTDGYLRVVFLYKDADVAAKLQPEALYKAARCFDKLGQSGRAELMRAELKGSYPSSPWANK